MVDRATEHVKGYAEREKNLRVKIISLNVFCLTMSLACYVCCGYNCWSARHQTIDTDFNMEQIGGDIEQAKKQIQDLFNGVETELNDMLYINHVMMSTLLSLVIAGLISSYIALVYSIRKYFSE